MPSNTVCKINDSPYANGVVTLTNVAAIPPTTIKPATEQPYITLSIKLLSAI